MLGSLGPARRAYREHERVLELDPARKDAGLIVGLYRYGVASLPAPLRLLAHLAGFGSGRERGLRLVEDASRYPSHVQSNALFMLVLLYNREARYDDALHVIVELQSRYPRNRLLWLEAGGTALRAGRPAVAKGMLEEGLARLAVDARPRAAGEEARWRYTYGAALGALDDPHAADRELRMALALATRDWLRGRVHKELGKLADRSGNRVAARDAYRLADRLCRADHDSECADDLKQVRCDDFVGHRSRCLTGFAAVLIGACLVAARSVKPPAAAWSRAALTSTFDSGIRNLVTEWDPDDRRPPAVRRRALFDFMYETYDASAWIPQSLFDTNAVTHAIVGDVDTIVGDKVGLVLWRDNPRVPAFGMAPNAGADAPLRWTVNCLVCHTAEIDGRAYLGAGTKTFDELWLGSALKQLTSERWRGRLAGRPEDRALAANANRILNAHHHDKIDSLSRARSTAFAASHVEMFMRAHEGAMPDRSRRWGAATSRPHRSGTPPRRCRSASWYTDGSFHGPYPLMASSMELEKDRLVRRARAASWCPGSSRNSSRSSVTSGRRAIRIRSIEALAARGRELFYSQDIGCHRCHGIYDGRGNVQWPGVHADVGTDRARLDVVSPGFIEAFNASPLAAEGSLVRSRGYAATPLTGVWANFPYLHNGSVPTLHHLLGPVGERPQLFEILAARRLDRERVGQPLYADPRAGCCPPWTASSGSAKTATGSTPRAMDVPTRATISGRPSVRMPIAWRSLSTSKHSK